MFRYNRVKCMQIVRASFYEDTLFHLHYKIVVNYTFLHMDNEGRHPAKITRALKLE